MEGPTLALCTQRTRSSNDVCYAMGLGSFGSQDLFDLITDHDLLQTSQL